MDVHISNLVRDYGKFRALDQISFRVGKGMFGLLGPNGAGKTTLMKIITTLLPLTSGQVTVGSEEVMHNPGFVRQHLGYIPQDFGFYKSLNAYELLDYIGTMKGLSRSERQHQVGSLLEQVNLTKDAKRRVGGYSGGMKQRLGIAQAFLGSPRLLLLDELTRGLDVTEQERVFHLLAQYHHLAIFSTHIPQEAARVAQTVIVLHGGRVLFCGTVDELCAVATGQVYEVTVPIAELPKITNSLRLSRMASYGAEARLRVLGKSSLPNAVAVSPSLEDAYLLLTRH